MKKIFIFLSIVWIFSTVVASLVIGYIGGVRGLGLLGIAFFLTGGVVVILAQFIPAGILVSAMVKSVFSSSRRGEVPARA